MSAGRAVFSTKRACLEAALDGTFEFDWKSRPPPTGVPLADFLMTQDILGWSMKMDMRVVGFTRNGYYAARQLVKHLRDQERAYSRCVRPSTLFARVLEYIRNLWVEGKRVPISSIDVQLFEDHLETWLGSFRGTRLHVVPCSILRYAVPQFSIGPVRFIHSDQFDPTQFGIEEWQRASEPLRRAMERAEATWFATVGVDDCEPSRSGDVAEITVDLAIGAIQLFIPESSGRNMARVTARAMPPFKATLSVPPDGQWSGFNEFTEAGISLLPAYFERALTQASADIKRMGQLIESFRVDRSTLPGLAQAWCDATYWFHEGLSEPLDPIAITKLETAIENLFNAGSSAGSKSRLLTAFKYILGMESNAVLDTALPVTVKQFVESVVTARSRVLHGTWSTLNRHDFEVARADVVKLARSLLIAYPKKLFSYMRDETTTARDNTQDLLAWVKNMSSREGPSQIA